ncbi:IS1182 family transposase [Flavobacterium cellulosilyticum]|uniref:IS1182 family transposase n=1 Tax=Flavobacterium cellulosilyticum TaxID=2541731 RepID=A0A4R5CD93_9FLAO|nr:IS1182 family transposase [Flavobacterium cellulosilyticum]TDD96223.1 IS1182 family transposase [Flavobacterium cellulosilyticum]
MSKFIIGTNRNQLPLFATSIDDAIAQDNEIRLIDLFVDSLKLSDFGFNFEFVENGRPAYHPSDLLKLFIYGYLNRMRSSRTLEKECSRNIELIWLMKGLVPDHNTISNFRKDNPKAIARVFRATVKMAAHFELIGGTLVAGDSTKLRAQNSKKNNFNPAKIERHIAYIDARLQEYNAALAKEDGDSENNKIITKKIQKHTNQKQKYIEYQNTIDTTGVTQISTSDPDSRQIMTRNNISEVAYTVQTVVDAQHNIPIDFKVTNENDSKAMGGMLRRSKTILGHNNFTAIYDKGYHTGSEFKYANMLGIDVLVAIPGVAAHAPDLAFDVEHFKYNKDNDSYTCPANEILTTNGNWYNKTNGKSITKMKHYKTAGCLSCVFFSQCTKNKKGRLIERSQYADLIYENKIRMENNYEIYRKRQAIVEHPYGVIKRQWGFYYIMTKKTIKHASADVGLIFTAYNLRRIFNLIDQNLLKQYLKMLTLFVLAIRSFFKAFYAYTISYPKLNIYSKKYLTGA